MYTPISEYDYYKNSYAFRNRVKKYLRTTYPQRIITFSTSEKITPLTGVNLSILGGPRGTILTMYRPSSIYGDYNKSVDNLVEKSMIKIQRWCRWCKYKQIIVDDKAD